jgi:hypothetical protein
MILNVRVIPNAKKSQIMEQKGTSLRVRVAAPDREGKANAKLIEILTEYFGVKRRDVVILRGGKHREKVVEIKNVA